MLLSCFCFEKMIRLLTIFAIQNYWMLAVPVSQFITTSYYSDFLVAVEVLIDQNSEGPSLNSFAASFERPGRSADLPIVLVFVLGIPPTLHVSCQQLGAKSIKLFLKWSLPLATNTSEKSKQDIFRVLQRADKIIVEWRYDKPHITSVMSECRPLCQLNFPSQLNEGHSRNILWIHQILSYLF